MEVVAAGVHHTGDLGAVGPLILLLHGQCVHVGPDEDGGAGNAAVQFSQDGVAGNAGAHGDAQLGQFVFDKLGGLLLVEGQLGILVEMAAIGQQLFLQRPGNGLNFCFAHGQSHLSV